MLKYLSLCTIIFALFSCATYVGNMGDSASLSGNNFEITGWAQGQSSAKYIFGIGGLNKDQLVFDAKRDLYKNHPLKKGQTYANISVDFKTLYVLPYVKRTAIINADIVQFYTEDEKVDTALQHLFKDMVPHEYNVEAFAVGAEVMVLENNFLYSGSITSLQNETAEVSFLKENQSVKSFPLSVLFSTNFELFDSQLTLDQEAFYVKEEEWVKSVIKGVNARYFLLETDGVYSVQYRSHLNDVKGIVYFMDPMQKYTGSQQSDLTVGQEVMHYDRSGQNAVVLQVNQKSVLLYLKDSATLVKAKSENIFSLKDPFMIEGKLFMRGSKFIVYGQTTNPLKLELLAVNEKYALLLKDKEVVKEKKSKLKPVED